MLWLGVKLIEIKFWAQFMALLTISNKSVLTEAGNSALMSSVIRVWYEIPPMTLTFAFLSKTLSLLLFSSRGINMYVYGYLQGKRLCLKKSLERHSSPGLYTRSWGAEKDCVIGPKTRGRFHNELD